MTSRPSGAKPAKKRQAKPKAKPSPTRATPRLAKAKPHLAKAKPKIAKAKPKIAKAKPALAKAKPKVTKAKPPSGPYPERFDRSPYEMPTMELGEAIALATALLAAKPARPTPAIAEESAQISNARERAEAVHRDSDEATSIEARPFDVAMDRAWATLVRRIQDYAELPVARYPDAATATKVYAIVEDLSILKLNYLAEFAQIGSRLDALKREGLLDAARTFAGAAFLDEVLHCHAAYGEALGVMDAPRSETANPDRGAARLALIEAIGEYTVQVLALARAGRPDSWKVVHASLAPITELRARQGEQLRAKPPARVLAAHPAV